MQQIAKELDSCHRIARKLYVTDEQFARVLEAHRSWGPSSITAQQPRAAKLRAA